MKASSPAGGRGDSRASAAGEGGPDASAKSPLPPTRRRGERAPPSPAKAGEGAAAPQAKDKLATYAAKRDFSRTAEPAGGTATPAGNSFIVQKHAATRLHWDFRLELDGVLLSWAVTKPPSTDPAVKRLAVRTEDHPLDYASFEGTIPKGEYGGGTVMLWDRGTWTNEADPREGMRKGKLHFTLTGERMKGKWVLIRLKPEGGKAENWLLGKIADEFATGVDLDFDASIASGRSMAAIAAGEATLAKQKPAGHSKASGSGRGRKAPAGTEATPLPEREGPGVGGRRKASARAGAGPPNPQPVIPANAGTHLPSPEEMGPRFRGDDNQKPRRKVHPPTPNPSRKREESTPPPFRSPQLATLVDRPPTGSDWLHETKYDGYRALVAVGGGRAVAYSRSGLDWTAKFGSVPAACAALPCASALLDGEIVALDAAGKPNFSALQATLKGGGALRYFVFDLLELDGENLADLPLTERKARLARLLDGASPPLHYSEHVRGGGEAMFAALCAEGYEGVVSKRADGRSRPGRSGGWLKAKCTLAQEFVIGGWSKSDKGRGFASLLLGVQEAGGLRYVGRVGTGFDDRTLETLSAKLAALKVDRSPFAGKLDAAARRGATFVRPELVAEVAFAEFTADGSVRHASFLGLREDKVAADVVAEVATSSHEGASAGAGAKTPPVIPAKAGTHLRTLEEMGPDFRRDDKKGQEKKAPLTPDRHGIRVTSPDRLVFPELGLTKGALVDYYATVADVMLETTGDRPISLVRCPQGRAKTCFFQKHDSGIFSDAVHHVDIAESDGHTEAYLYVDSPEGLLNCVQMGTIEFHGWGSK
ncbi:MAG: DNA ligase D, partial [Sphingomonadaceae bacterium]|nr:DNA ligase D [Sphingomonadaceae bacterium]